MGKHDLNELGANSEQARVRSRADPEALHLHLEAPLLYLSSREAGWEGLVAEAFLEPNQLEGWRPPAAAYVTVILFAGGPLHLNTRYDHGPRSTLIVHAGELTLRPGTADPYEVGWKGLSSTPTRTLHMHLDPDLLLHTAQALAAPDPAQVSLLSRAGFQDALLREIGLALWQELEHSTPIGKLYVQTAAQMLAVHLLRHYASTPLRIKEFSQLLTQRQLKRVTDFVLADLQQDLSLEALAAQAGFSPYHFARLFRRTTGESPHQFVLRQRIERAQALLRVTNAPLAYIALESGFASQSHLTRAFKRRLGLTPRAYRQRL